MYSTAESGKYVDMYCFLIVQFLKLKFRISGLSSTAESVEAVQDLAGTLPRAQCGERLWREHLRHAARGTITKQSPNAKTRVKVKSWYDDHHGHGRQE